MRLRDGSGTETIVAKQPDSEGFLYRRVAGDRLIGVMPQTYGCACLGIGALRASGFDDVWDFPSIPRAILAAEQWDPATTPEPDGWHRHPGSGRYRPGGDPKQEYTKERT